MVGFEVLHWMRSRKSGRTGYAALKLDMSKAYDRVEWQFLQALMDRLGFDPMWIQKIMNCVKSVSYSFKVNDLIAGPILPTRGLRQGDPLSPFLFVLCAQGLSALLNSFENMGLFKGVKIAATCPSISHLFFADDSLMFFRATLEYGTRVKECISCYDKASGQIINCDKSALSFSPNTNPFGSLLLSVKILNVNWRIFGGVWRMEDVKCIENLVVLCALRNSEGDAGLGSNPSYIWRSPLWSKELLVSGLLWRVGDGKSIHIYKDRWIPSMQSELGFSVGPWIGEVTVNSLIKDGSWDADSIWNRFNSYVAREILRIPLPQRHRNDALFWRYDSKGKYYVKDGCRLQSDLFAAPINQHSYPNENWWSFLWSLSIPPKVRVFWWRVSHDCIASKQNIARHHVPVNASCELCNFPYDSTCRALFHCSAIKHLWKATQFASLIRKGQGANTLVFCLWMMENLSKVDFERFAMYSWAIWKLKQTYLHGDRKVSFNADLEWSSALLSDFHKVQDLVLGVWCGIARAVYCRPLIESDSLLAVQAVTTNQEHLDYVGGCAEEISSMLKAPVVSRVGHIRRQANSVAHKLAIFALSSQLPFIY
ncbi:uncharacterized protein [Henckelia pumila]|uniref:uncharacterized protein n=1 Tax=Henckelia pumila TaxID=405737 RepID=UPI003C6E99E5